MAASRLAPLPLFVATLACNPGSELTSSGTGLSASLGTSLSATGDGGTDTGMGVPALFDESGVWAVERYSLDGGPWLDIAAGRANRFLLRFMPADGVVAAAACHEQGSVVDIEASTCTNAMLSSWSCACFAYTFEADRMLWQAFDPGEPPPVVGEGAHELIVSDAGQGTYAFESLPSGLYGSDGAVAKHAFGSRADAVWTAVDLNADMQPDLEACSLACFPSAAGG